MATISGAGSSIAALTAQTVSSTRMATERDIMAPGPHEVYTIRDPFELDEPERPNQAVPLVGLPKRQGSNRTRVPNVYQHALRAAYTRPHASTKKPKMTESSKLTRVAPVET